MGLLIYTDGGSRNNPGEAGIGAVIYQGEQKIAEISEYLGVRTNNWAEYQAVIRALEEIQSRGITERPIEIRMDSKLVVEQLSGNWKIKEPTLMPQAARAKELMAECGEVLLTHVRREFNKEADALANLAMDRAA